MWKLQETVFRQLTTSRFHDSAIEEIHTFFRKMMEIIGCMWLLTPSISHFYYTTASVVLDMPSNKNQANFFMSSLSAYFHIFLLLRIDFERETRKKYWKIPCRYFWRSFTKSVILIVKFQKNKGEILEGLQNVHFLANIITTTMKRWFMLFTSSVCGHNVMPDML